MYDRLNRELGFSLATRPALYIVLSVLGTILLSASLVRIEFETDIRASFSPKNSKATYETDVYNAFYNISALPQRSFVLFTSRDNGSMLRPITINEVMRVDKIMRDKLEMRNHEGKRSCDPLCDLNAPFHLFIHEWRKFQNDSAPNNATDTVLHYPTSQFFSNDVFIGMNMFGVQTAPEMFANRSHITHVQAVILWYMSQVDTTERREVLKETTLNLFEVSKAGNFSEHISFEIFGDEIANAEMIRGALEATLLMSVGFGLLLVFVTWVVWNHCSIKAMPAVVSAAVLSPFFAAAASFGILTWLGFKMYSIMCVTPFLVLGIGVDDAFIMIHSWNHFGYIENKSERLARVIVAVGPSITITSLTNTIAFGIGYATPTPQMSLFCLCTSIAVLLDFVLTFTLFAPIMVLCAESKDKDSSNSYSLSLQSSGPKETSELFFCYTKFICSAKGRVVALIAMCLLYLVSGVGIVSMRSTFEPAKAFPSDSPLANSLYYIRAVFNEFFPMNVIVNRPPNISDVEDYDRFYRMVTDLEELPESYNRDRTVLWLIAYEKFDRSVHGVNQLLNLLTLNDAVEYQPSFNNLQTFLDQLLHPPIIKYEMSELSGVKELKAFQMTVIASNMAEWANRAQYVEKCRSILEGYPEYNATIFDGDSAILDLILTVRKDLLGSIAVTVSCMATVCLFFITNKIGVAIITYIISSTCFTLVGILSWWGADMDPVTMVDVLIATGFSVDYTAHIAYHFYSETGPTPERISRSLHEMCGPMVQAGSSTILCMLPLVFVPTYAIVAFAKTVFIVVSVGLFHGIFLLPVLLSFMPRKLASCRSQNCETSLMTADPHKSSQAKPLI
ncbi:hypothetical protein L596_018980 [Steinernema carpocapsae]|uniref:SSD domain-containing protein n=1 Tax=Steinernema carpocapsae TaxID=34508 RepID=A0A4U5N7Q7_STECR|nr:hypothetical protein L596_018980 [Steinernema carpocapsae]